MRKILHYFSDDVNIAYMTQENFTGPRHGITEGSSPLDDLMHRMEEEVLAFQQDPEVDEQIAGGIIKQYVGDILDVCENLPPSLPLFKAPDFQLIKAGTNWELLNVFDTRPHSLPENAWFILRARIVATLRIRTTLQST